MKTLAVVLFLCLSLFGSDISSDLESAKKSGKIPAFFIVKTGCPWCHKTKVLIEKDKEVKALIEKDFHFVEFNKDDIELSNDMATRFFPTIHFTDYDGDVIYQIMGYKEKNVFLQELKDVKEIFKKK